MEATQASFSHSLPEEPMGEACKDALRLALERRLKLEFHGATVTSDGGLLAYRELDDALGLTSTVDSELRDIRTGKNRQHSLTALPRQSIYSRLSGYEDAFLRGVSAMLVTRRLEIEALILVLLTALRAGVPIMTLNGKSRRELLEIGFAKQAISVEPC